MISGRGVYPIPLIALRARVDSLNHSLCPHVLPRLFLRRQARKVRLSGRHPRITRILEDTSREARCHRLGVSTRMCRISHSLILLFILASLDQALDLRTSRHVRLKLTLIFCWNRQALGKGAPVVK